LAILYRKDTGAITKLLNIEDLLLRAGLLAREGQNARPLAERMARVARAGGGRSCFEGGGALQFSVDAPGEPELNVGIRLGDDPDRAALAELVDASCWAQLENVVEDLPEARHGGLGSWLQWRKDRQALFFDLRDRDPVAARQRLDCVLDDTERQALDRIRPPTDYAREWAAKITCDHSGRRKLSVYWLLHRFSLAENLAERQAPGSWPQITQALGVLLRRPGRSGRWAVTTEIGDETRTRLRFNNTAWVLVPEDAQKQRTIGALMDRYSGPRRYAESLWSLCRGVSTPKWKVGRTCEVSVSQDRVATRLYFAPQTSA
jgi:hypothetical protein